MSPMLLIARKEAGELLLSPRGLAWLMALAVALSAFALLLVGNTELSLLDNAQVVYDMVAIVTAMGGLLALVIGIDSVAGERERGSLVALLLTPASRDSILFGKLGGVAIAWAAMYALALPYLWAVGSTGQNLWQGMFLLALLGSPVVLGFGFLGMGLGSLLATARGGLLLGPSLRQSAVGRAFDLVNPFSAAVDGYDAVIIDSQTILAQWPHLAVAAVWLALALWLARSGFRRIVH
jgi:ABC-type transport system involved in multi-copper enzyme maturation permease subunit